ncbi:MAG: glycosyltransferase family 4 protein [Kaiparowitsia implicata GSE-PSE-MK54-09C]|jgi:glycosyltransferase involved in cell wall biosynthesis|nr:glycosyltransferase family 4 protein [Kaiparowitsia implicata GSE-PSE-MK54-09C]
MLNNSENTRLTIFIPHPSDLLTNVQPHGDGLVAFEFISRLAERGHSVHVATSHFDIQGELNKNIHLYPMKVDNHLKISGRLSYLIKLRKVFKEVSSKHRIDVIHQLNPVVPGITLALFPSKEPIFLGPVPAASNEYRGWAYKLLSGEYWPKQILRSLKKILVFLQQQQAAAVLVATPAAYNRLLLPRLMSEKIHNLTPGIDVKKFAALIPSEPYPIYSTDNSPSILFLGKVTDYKGIFVLLDAFERINQKIPSCQLRIAGGWGKEIEQVKDRICRMSTPSKVSLLGKVERARIPELMQSSTVFCFPSFSEPFGMVALEAMACGKPIVGSNSGGLGYLIHEKGGRKVPPGDSILLANALLEVLQSAELQQEMGCFNRTLVETTYDWDQIINRLEDIYQKTIALKS